MQPAVFVQSSSQVTRQQLHNSWAKAVIFDHAFRTHFFPSNFRCALRPTCAEKVWYMSALPATVSVWFCNQRVHCKKFFWCRWWDTRNGSRFVTSGSAQGIVVGGSPGMWPKLWESWDLCPLVLFGLSWGDLTVYTDCMNVLNGFNRLVGCHFSPSHRQCWVN